MKAMLFAILLAFTATLAAPAQAEESYVWDGSSLQPIRSTQAPTCSNWAIWYFKRGVSQTPGTQWGAALGRSAGEVLQVQKKGQEDYENWAVVKAKYHMRIPDDPQVYDNYLGPICVTKAAFDAKPGAVRAIEEAGELAGRISGLISQIRTVLKGARTAIKTGYQGYYLQDGEKNQVEEFLDRIQGISENVCKVQNALMQHLGPTMMQINGQINTITKQLGQANGDLPAIRKLVSAQSTPTVSKAWMSKTQDTTNDFGNRIQTSFQEVPGGILVTAVHAATSNSYGFTEVYNVQFSNISTVSPGMRGIDVRLKAPIIDSITGDSNDLVYFDFEDEQGIEDASTFLRAQIQ